MRLRTDRRSILEIACRTGAFLLLALLIFRALQPAKVSGGGITLAAIDDLSKVTRTSQPRIHFTLESTPTAWQRAWLRALRSAGSEVTWSGSLQPLAVASKPNALPEGGYTLSGFSRGDSVVRIRDGLSLIDSSVTRSGFFSFPLSATSGHADIAAGRESASAGLRDSVHLRHVLVFGRAGWETKFVIAALEEAGWKTDAVVFVAPSVTTTQGSALIDTAHYSAVIAIDESAAPRASEINAFVRSGGGLILGQTAARLENFASLRVSTAAPELPRPLPVTDTASRISAPFTPLLLRESAVPLEQRGRDIAVGAMRVGFGRVAQIGFSETWHWRMQGSQQSMIDHRDWWSGLVSSVSYAPGFSATVEDDRTPYADFISIAGQSVARARTEKRLSDPANDLIWFALVVGLLLAEWASRRLRGVA